MYLHPPAGVDLHLEHFLSQPGFRAPQVMAYILTKHLQYPPPAEFQLPDDQQQVTDQPVRPCFSLTSLTVLDLPLSFHCTSLTLHCRRFTVFRWQAPLRQPPALQRTPSRLACWPVRISSRRFSWCFSRRFSAFSRRFTTIICCVRFEPECCAKPRVGSNKGRGCVQGAAATALSCPVLRSISNPGSRELRGFVLLPQACDVCDLR